MRFGKNKTRKPDSLPEIRGFFTPRGLRGWGFFDSIGDITLLIRPPNFFNMAENNKTNIFRKRRFCTFIWCNELIHVSYRKNMKNPER